MTVARSSDRLKCLDFYDTAGELQAAFDEGVPAAAWCCGRIKGTERLHLPRLPQWMPVIAV